MQTFRFVILAGLVSVLAACSGERSTLAIKASGEKAYSRGNYELAATEFTEVVDREPGDWRARLALAESLVRLEQFVSAREQLEVLYDLRPEDSHVINLLALSMLRSGDVDGMTALLQGRAEETGSVEDYIRLGRFLADAGDNDNAEAALLNAARLDRGINSEPQVTLALFYDSIGEEESALRRYRMALYVAPDRKDVQEAIRAHGEVPGPTFALVPTERSTAVSGG